MDNDLIHRIEKILLIACGALLLFFYIYVYGFGKVRGPLARKAYYRLGDVSDERIRQAQIEEQRSQELLMSTPTPAEE